ncbi:hypothetical protein HNQ35_000609 [Cerasibacillus quisquiliarum]|nr:hypothetical protein [Cerasibacillus quisquiliarum]
MNQRKKNIILFIILLIIALGWGVAYWFIFVL